MKQRFYLFRRRGTYYLQDSRSGKQLSLETKDRNVAARLLEAKRQLDGEPGFNQFLLKTCLAHSDPMLKASGISRSYISRLLSGEFSELSDANFTSLLKTFSADPQAQAELVAARCMDARVGPGSELVEISIKGHGARSAKQQEFPEVELSHETERAFAWLRSHCPLNPELEKHLVGYAKLTGMK